MKRFFLLICVFLVFSECTIQKRLYRKGFYIEKFQDLSKDRNHSSNFCPTQKNKIISEYSDKKVLLNKTDTSNNVETISSIKKSSDLYSCTKRWVLTAQKTNKISFIKNLMNNDNKANNKEKIILPLKKQKGETDNKDVSKVLRQRFISILVIIGIAITIFLITYMLWEVPFKEWIMFPRDYRADNNNIGYYLPHLFFTLFLLINAVNQVLYVTSKFNLSTDSHLKSEINLKLFFLLLSTSIMFIFFPPSVLLLLAIVGTVYFLKKKNIKNYDDEDVNTFLEQEYQDSLLKLFSLFIFGCFYYSLFLYTGYFHYQFLQR